MGTIATSPTVAGSGRLQPFQEAYHSTECPAPHALCRSRLATVSCVNVPPDSKRQAVVTIPFGRDTSDTRHTVKVVASSLDGEHLRAARNAAHTSFPTGKMHSCQAEPSFTGFLVAIVGERRKHACGCPCHRFERGRSKSVCHEGRHLNALRQAVADRTAYRTLYKTNRTQRSRHGQLRNRSLSS